MLDILHGASREHGARRTEFFLVMRYQHSYWWATINAAREDVPSSSTEMGIWRLRT
ncbi:hypothetical protein CERZMDRAFT_91062 [Cercospora zeae-maydis SCOH1-5]|uniref:Uncharacterized protein n=1 Tax=Cercospora zeae-maydis SCOH1-5 TaxID=717836 RepID=A0A6A6FBP6_9PEZI|nr:hypothetical protein CERZMDRAFT_91062 [Cercospora zeae-maydis SCOH1-5]